MKYLIDKLSDLGIVKISVSGKLNQDIREEILSKAISELDTSGYNKLLIDATNATDVKAPPFSSSDNLEELSNPTNNLKTKYYIQVAFLITQAEAEANNSSFVHLSHLQNGINVKYFSDYDEAMTWLLEGKDIFTC